MEQMGTQITGAFPEKGKEKQGEQEGEGACQADQTVDIFAFPHGIKTGGKVGDPCLKPMADQSKTEHIYRKDKLVNAQFFCTDQVGEEYPVIEPQNSGEKSGKGENQSSGKNGFFVGHRNTWGWVLLNI